MSSVIFKPELSNIENEYIVSFDYKSKISFNLPMPFLLPLPNLYHTGGCTLKRKTGFLKMTKDEIISIEKGSTKQATLRENRITSSNTHKIFI